MRSLKGISASILFLVIGCQFMLLPDRTYAWLPCCGYCQCAKTCRCYHPTACPMAGPCRSDSNTFHIKSLADADTLLDGSFLAPLTATERLTEIARGGECARKKFTLNLLSSVGDSLEFEPIRFDEKNIQDTVVFQVTTNEER